MSLGSKCHNYLCWVEKYQNKSCTKNIHTKNYLFTFPNFTSLIIYYDVEHMTIIVTVDSPKLVNQFLIQYICCPFAFFQELLYWWECTGKPV